MTAERLRRTAHFALRAASLAGLALLPLLGACSWFTDFKQTPVVYPWESANDSVPPRGNPQFSVPVQGSTVPAYLVSYRAQPDSFASLANPVPADARSIENGKRLYQINCAVCHGLSASGNGPITKYGGPSFNLRSTLGARSDGYIWGIIRNGRNAMPPYSRIEDAERWDIANYLRALGAGSADSVLVGLPGETGDKLPRASEMGPTRPAPYFNHFGMQAGAPRQGVPAIGPPRADSAGVPAATGATTTAQPAAPPRTDTTSNRGQQP
jgi:mono/diheme cytochrome c family protein